jgi:hypothetical protein
MVSTKFLIKKKVFSCLLYAFSKCHCFKRVAPWATLDQSNSTMSDNNMYALAIPRAKLVQSAADRRMSMGSESSGFTVREELERQVITDVTRTEVFGGAHQDGTGFNYESIGRYDSRGGGNQSFSEFTRDQDDRSVDSYHTNEHRVYDSLSRR